jgi:hypothetical protein
MLGDEMVVMSMKDSTLFTLNPVATAIWLAADGAMPLEEIVKTKVCSEFDVDLSVAYADAEALTDQLAGHGILLVSDKPLVPAPAPSQESR